MKAIIAGAGRFGGQAAQVLCAAGHRVTLIDLDSDVLARLALDASIRLVEGDACEPAVLEEAGAHAVDLLVAATGEDEDNLVISLLAKRQFAVPRVAARVNAPDDAWLFDQRWGVDVAVPAAAPLISLIEEATGAAETVALLRLARAGVTVIETAITSESSACGRSLDSIRLPGGAIIAAVIREGQPVVPTGAMNLVAGDELLVISRSTDADEVDAAFH